MKRGRLPLTALRSFEAAGRHLSFSRAADELFVSQAAISRQVRELEQLLGTLLFQRYHRKVELTEGGRELLAELVGAFDSITAALDRIAVDDRRNIVRLSVDPAIAACWLVPRLERFRQTFPDIDLMLLVEPRIIDFRTGEADLGLRFSYQSTSWPGTETIQLLDAWEAPMLSTELAEKLNLSSPDDLLSLNLLHEETRLYWRDWFRLAGIEDARTVSLKGPLLVDPALTRQATLLGQGIMLGDLFYLQQDIISGALVIPFPVYYRIGAYFLATHRFERLNHAARQVVQWIETQAAETSDFVDRMRTVNTG